MIGTFHCLGCNYIFKMKPGPHVRCPKCERHLCAWVDYREEK